MMKVRFALAILGWLFGALVVARAIAGPITVPVSIRTPINVESFCALLLTAAFLIGTPKPDPRHSVRGIGTSIALCLLALLVAFGFWRAIGTYFLADDFVLVTRANAFSSGRVKELLTTAEASAFFRPMVHLTMAVTAKWAGFDPRLWRASALALHAVNSFLVFVIASRLRWSQLAAILGGALFAIHGGLPESVVWIAGWFGTLSTLFVLLGLLFFIAHLDSKRHARFWYGIASFGAMILALMSKETAYAFPLLALLIVWFRRVQLQHELPMIAAIIGGTVSMFIYRWSLLGGIGGYTEVGGGGALMMRLGLLAVLRSLFLRIWAVLYFPMNWSREPGIWLGILLAAYVAALTYAAIKASSARSVAFATAFVLVAALPPLEQLLIGSDLQKSRELYLPLAGFCLLLSAAVDSLRGRARWLVPAAVIAFNLAALQHNLTAWKDVGATAQRACAEAARCSKAEKVSSVGLPGSLDGVYFLGVGFPECVALAAQTSSPATDIGQELLWNSTTREIECRR